MNAQNLLQTRWVVKKTDTCKFVIRAEFFSKNMLIEDGEPELEAKAIEEVLNRYLPNVVVE